MKFKESMQGFSFPHETTPPADPPALPLRQGGFGR